MKGNGRARRAAAVAAAAGLVTALAAGATDAGAAQRATHLAVAWAASERGGLQAAVWVTYHQAVAVPNPAASSVNASRSGKPALT